MIIIFPENPTDPYLRILAQFTKEESYKFNLEEGA